MEQKKEAEIEIEGVGLSCRIAGGFAASVIYGISDFEISSSKSIQLRYSSRRSPAASVKEELEQGFDRW